MNNYVTGAVIWALREKNQLTQARFHRRGVGKLYWYCNRHGLFCQKIGRTAR